MSTLNLRALERVEEKLKERLARIKEEAFDSSEFADFKRYVGMREGLQLALDLVKETEQEMQS